MSLHPVVLADLLDTEVRQARDRLGQRVHDLRREGDNLLMTLVRPDGTWTLRLGGERYDAEPFDVALVNDDGAVLPLERWIPGFAHSVHSSLGVPWVCVDGTRAYYCWEGHHAERWDSIRYAKRADSLLEHLLTKAGL